MFVKFGEIRNIQSIKMSDPDSDPETLYAWYSEKMRNHTSEYERYNFTTKQYESCASTLIFKSAENNKEVEATIVSENRFSNACKFSDCKYIGKVYFHPLRKGS